MFILVGYLAQRVVGISLMLVIFENNNKVMVKENDKNGKRQINKLLNLIGVDAHFLVCIPHFIFYPLK